MKRWIRRTGLPILCFLLWGIRADASSQDIILKTEENKVTVTMGASDKDLVSMQITLDVKITQGDANTKVSFEFDEGLPGSVKQYRYDRNTGMLNLYISGNASQKLSSEEYSLGQVVLKAGEGSASATVSVKQNSLRFVNDAYDLYQVGQINATPEQKVTDGEDQTDVEVPAPGPDEDGNQTGSSGGSSGGSSSSSGGSSQPPAVDAGSGAVPAVRVKPGRGVGIRTGGSYTAAADPVDTPEEMPSEDEEEKTEEEASDTEEEQPKDFLPIPEEEQEPSSRRSNLLLLLGLTAALAAAGVVIFLMVQEYDRRKKRARAKSQRRRQTGQKKQLSHEKKKRKTNKDRP